MHLWRYLFLKCEHLIIFLKCIFCIEKVVYSRWSVRCLRNGLLCLYITEIHWNSCFKVVSFYEIKCIEIFEKLDVCMELKCIGIYEMDLFLWNWKALKLLEWTWKFVWKTHPIEFNIFKVSGAKCYYMELKEIEIFGKLDVHMEFKCNGIHEMSFLVFMELKCIGIVGIGF